MASIQTFAAALPFHPHVHALATDGLLARGGEFAAFGPDARVREGPDGRLLVRAGPSEVAFSPLDLIHVPAQQIPENGQHLVRWCGAYSHRSRRLHANEAEAGGPGGQPTASPGDRDSGFARARRKSSSRLMRKVLGHERTFAAAPRAPRTPGHRRGPARGHDP